MDFTARLRELKATGQFDGSTVEVVGYDDEGKPRVFDPLQSGKDRYGLPHRLDTFYGIDRVTLNFVMPDERCTQFAVYFDTADSGLGRPERYTGLVGDGDFFRQEYGRREIGASHMDDFCDFDGDGDLDLFKCTIEPFIYVYENVGGGRFVDRGRLTSGGELFIFPHSAVNRSWPVITFCDWDDDGDQDLFATFCDGPETGQVLRFENTTQPGGLITFTNRGRLLSASGGAMGSQWFASITVADWDGDGKKDILASRHDLVGQKDDRLEFHRNISDSRELSQIKLAEPEYIQADGQEIHLRAARFTCADIDADGDLDLFATTQGSQVFLYRNIGTRTKPVLAAAEELPSRGGGHNGVKVADFNSDGLLDYAVGNLWEGGNRDYEGRAFARLFKNIGTKTAPRFEERDARHGGLYTEQFQICDAARQNVVRAVDWDNDGKTDLIASTSHGAIYWFRNLGTQRWPIFAPEQKVLKDVGSGARSDVCDWNNDGKKDLLVANMKGQLTLYLNTGTDAAPVLDAGTPVTANGKIIDGTLWCNVLVTDWDNDGRKDVILGMGGEGNPSEFYDWPHLNSNPSEDRGFLFYCNIGTDAEPILSGPKWIKGGGKVISYTRPNVGSYVDWDGDGKKDFIACEFEANVRFYKNVGSGQRGDEPRFETAAGQIIVEPWTRTQMISGAHAVDWNGDGDIDILTGQGHGGSGLRYYERDYIEDRFHDTPPKVGVSAAQRRAEDR